MLKLFNVIHWDNYTTITIHPKTVKKSIAEANIVDKWLHKNLYKKILPEHYKDIKYSTTRNRIYLTYRPVGYLSIPKNENDLWHAISDILKIVGRLHSEEVVNWDIYWDNVVKLKAHRW